MASGACRPKRGTASSRQSATAAGTISYGALASALQEGYATASTDLRPPSEAGTVGVLPIGFLMRRYDNNQSTSSPE